MIRTLKNVLYFLCAFSMVQCVSYRPQASHSSIISESPRFHKNISHYHLWVKTQQNTYYPLTNAQIHEQELRGYIPKIPRTDIPAFDTLDYFQRRAFKNHILLGINQPIAHYQSPFHDTKMYTSVGSGMTFSSENLLLDTGYTAIRIPLAAVSQLQFMQRDAGETAGRTFLIVIGALVVTVVLFGILVAASAASAENNNREPSIVIDSGSSDSGDSGSGSNSGSGDGGSGSGSGSS